ncbi:protein of unknown function [Hyphomicrobium sp. MC1]|nr:protein of unknown function [Hyphomicrobium sp. MC1]
MKFSGGGFDQKMKRLRVRPDLRPPAAPFLNRTILSHDHFPNSLDTEIMVPILENSKFLKKNSWGAKSDICTGAGHESSSECSDAR